MKTYKSIILIITVICNVAHLAGQTRIGDPDVEFNTSLYDEDYPQMEVWASAGVKGGIPYIDNLGIKDTITSGSNSAEINSAITIVSGMGGGAVLLKNGHYTIDAEIKMKSNVSLIGETREGVICYIYMQKGNGFYFGTGINNSGIYRLTIEGSWGSPEHQWNIGSTSANNELDGNENVSVMFRESIDCWMDKVNIINSGDFPVRCNATHTTFRDLYVDGVFNKQGGAHGYFFVLDGHNLITGCQITRLRHISLQGDDVEYNVVYGNYFEQEISFHSGDDGNNLIENNKIVIPETMPGFQNPNYYAIMGPWSSQHSLSSKPNYLFKNQCLQLNYGHNNSTPWSDSSIVYYGPHYVKPADPYINFTEYNKGVPKGNTLYPVQSPDTVLRDFEPYVVFAQPQKRAFSVGDSIFVDVLASDDNEISSVKLFVDGNLISTKQSAPFVWTSAESGLNGMELGNYTLKAIAADNIGQTRSHEITVKVQDHKPTVKFIKPTESLFFIGDTIQVAVSATDDNIVSNVRLYLNDSLVRQINEAPYDWGEPDDLLRDIKFGSYEIKVIAEDNIGQTTEINKRINVIEKPQNGENAYLETFDRSTLDGWGTETYKGDYGYTWNLNCKGVPEGFINSTKCIYFHAGKTGLTSNTIQGGISSFMVECLDKWSVGIEREVELIVNGNVAGSMKHTGEEPYIFKVDNINIAGDFTLSLKNASSEADNNTVAFDNLMWITYTEIPSGIKQNGDENIKVFPNPFTDEINIENAGCYNLVSIYDISGRKLLTEDIRNQSEIKIRLEQNKFKKGIYLMEISGDSAKKVIKLQR